MTKKSTDNTVKAEWVEDKELIKDIVWVVQMHNCVMYAGYDTKLTRKSILSDIKGLCDEHRRCRGVIDDIENSIQRGYEQ